MGNHFHSLGSFNTMRREEVAENLTNQAFEFFYWFSRFEFALKENGHLKSHGMGSKAEPGWDEFVIHWQDLYAASPEAAELLAKPPEAQFVLANDQLAWRPVGLSDCRFDLAKVVRLIKTVRNNLFHGGKHGGASWDSPQRTASLLSTSKSVLDQLAQLASLEADYSQYY
jgi:hypothetical protein